MIVLKEQFSTYNSNQKRELIEGMSPRLRSVAAAAGLLGLGNTDSSYNSPENHYIVSNQAIGSPKRKTIDDNKAEFESQIRVWVKKGYKKVDDIPAEEWKKFADTWLFSTDPQSSNLQQRKSIHFIVNTLLAKLDSTR